MEISGKIINKINVLAISIISILPVIFILGSAIINLFIIVLDIIFIVEIFLKKEIKYLNNRYFYSLIVFWFILLINLSFSISFHDSVPRSLGFIRFVFFALAINYYLNNSDNKYKNFIFKIWTITFFLISLDLIYEYIFGLNTFGYKSYMPGRLSGFFNQELKIGHLYSALILICLSFVYLFLKEKKISNNNFIFLIIKRNIFYFFLVLFLFVSIIIGERSNFIKTLLMSVFFLFLLENYNYRKKIFSIFLGLLILTMIILNNESYKYRFWTMFIKPIINNPVEMIIKSNYGSHYKVAIEVFNNYKLTGVGLKNYRKEVTKDGYSKNPSTHPHQTHFEILSETGLIGYFSFLLLFLFNLFSAARYFIKKRNIYQLAGTLYVFVNLIPLIPSGSFFTSYGAALFWLNFGLMLPKNE
tara:strand:- start:40 stop:1284 length:1245 start_codon:yes stop_codon:yes gene_type:complete